MKIKKSVAQLCAVCLLVLMTLLTACGDTATSAPTVTTSAATTTSATTSTTTNAATTTSATTTPNAAATTSSASSSTTTVAATAATTSSSTAAATSAATTTSMATAATSATQTTYPLTLTDDNGRSVTIAKAPTKIVSLAPSNTEILFAEGLGDKVVGVDQYSDYPDAAKAIKKIGGFSDTNVESVTALSPDLVLAAGIQSKEQIAALEKQNLTVLVLNPQDLAGVVKDFKLVGQAANVNDKAQALADDFQKRLDAISAKVKNASAKPSVYFELDPTFYTVGPGSFVNDMIEKAGGQNIVTDASNPYPQLTQEVIISKNPQVIFVGDDTSGTDTPEKISARSGWNVIAAVKNKRVYSIDANLTNRPGPRAVDGVEQLAKDLYPDLFK